MKLGGLVDQIGLSYWPARLGIDSYGYLKGLQIRAHIPVQWLALFSLLPLHDSASAAEILEAVEKMGLSMAVQYN